MVLLSMEVPALGFLNKSIGVYNIRGIAFEPTLWEAVAIVVLCFLLIFTLARMRYLYLHWHLGKQNFSMLFWGFLLAMIVEGFLIISGRTLLTVVLGWKNAPKPIGTALDEGRSKLVKVLGADAEIPESQASEKPTYQSVVRSFDELSSDDEEIVRRMICKP